MAERGSGAIINLGSWIARLAVPVSSVYSSTKGAMETLTRAWAAEFGPAGVRVNAILDDVKDVTAAVKDVTATVHEETVRLDDAIRSTINRVDHTAEIAYIALGLQGLPVHCECRRETQRQPTTESQQLVHAVQS